MDSSSSVNDAGDADATLYKSYESSSAPGGDGGCPVESAAPAAGSRPAAAFLASAPLWTSRRASESRKRTAGAAAAAMDWAGAKNAVSGSAESYTSYYKGFFVKELCNFLSYLSLI